MPTIDQEVNIMQTTDLHLSHVCADCGEDDGQALVMALHDDLRMIHHPARCFGLLSSSHADRGACFAWMRGTRTRALAQ